MVFVVVVPVVLVVFVVAVLEEDVGDGGAFLSRRPLRSGSTGSGSGVGVDGTVAAVDSSTICQ